MGRQDPGTDIEMIVSDTHQIAFVHIPKCAGTTIRNALAPYDEAAERFHAKAVALHPTLGLLDYHHIPLAVLREHFPDDLSRLAAYRSFALVRDPFSRFPSSLNERFIQRDKRPLTERDPDEVAREIDDVMVRLAKHQKDTPVIEPDLIHFSRQRDYIFLDGRQVVETVRTTAEVDEVIRAVFQIIGQPPPPIDRVNPSLRYAFPAIRHLQFAITGPIEKVFPRWVWKPAYRPIKSVLRATRLVRQTSNPIEALPNSSEIEGFIETFYEEDIRLFQSLDTERRERIEISKAS